MAGCLLSSLSVLQLGQPGSSSSSWMMQREPTLKLMVASKLHRAQQAASIEAMQQQQQGTQLAGQVHIQQQQQQGTQLAGRVQRQQQQQQPVLLQQQDGAAGVVLVGAAGSMLQPTSQVQRGVATQNPKQQYTSRVSQRHTRPGIRQVGAQQQVQSSAGSSAAAYDAAADVQVIPGQQELPLPQQLQENLLQQQLTSAQSAGSTAAAAAAATGSLQAALLNGDESRPEEEPQQQSSSSSSSDAAAEMAISAAGTVHADLDPQDATSSYIMQRGVPPTRLKYPLWWHGPMWSGSGYGGGAGVM
jgi:hypothetical protein